MNEQTKSTFLAVAVGIVAGVGLLVGVGAMVGNAILPLMARGESLSQSQSSLERKLEKLDEKLDALDKKVDGLARAGAQRLAGGDAQRAPQPVDDTKVYDLPVGDSYILGKADAPVTIMEFSDLQCPFCSRFHTPLLEAFKAYPNDVKIIFKNFPLSMHPNARPAAKAALAAGVQGKYYEMIEQLLQNQNALTEDKFKEVAGKLGLNVEQFIKDLKDRDAEFEKKLEADLELGSKANVPGTPTYFLNGKKNNSRTPEAWKQAVEAALKEGKAEKK
ncbi:MAG: thioredoxin domain-containing protein [Candidatus Omnitrophica bacterium]|nr:thioredoxin domain-containing protein [Candidatus Omnitrophota bacterium]